MCIIWYEWYTSLQGYPDWWSKCKYISFNKTKNKHVWADQCHTEVGLGLLFAVNFYSLTLKRVGGTLFDLLTPLFDISAGPFIYPNSSLSMSVILALWRGFTENENSEFYLQYKQNKSFDFRQFATCLGSFSCFHHHLCFHNVLIFLIFVFQPLNFCHYLLLRLLPVSPQANCLLSSILIKLLEKYMNKYSNLIWWI